MQVVQSRSSSCCFSRRAAARASGLLLLLPQPLLLLPLIQFDLSQAQRHARGIGGLQTADSCLIGCRRGREAGSRQGPGGACRIRRGRTPYTSRQVLPCSTWAGCSAVRATLLQIQLRELSTSQAGGGAEQSRTCVELCRVDRVLRDLLLQRRQRRLRGCWHRHWHERARCLPSVCSTCEGGSLQEGRSAAWESHERLAHSRQRRWRQRLRGGAGPGAHQRHAPPPAAARSAQCPPMLPGRRRPAPWGCQRTRREHAEVVTKECA